MTGCIGCDLRELGYNIQRDVVFYRLNVDGVLRQLAVSRLRLSAPISQRLFELLTPELEVDLAILVPGTELASISDFN